MMNGFSEFISVGGLWRYGDYFLRLLVACLCGAAIGLERTKRFKEAGMRTHIIVCCTAALVMIVSKYGFADLTLPDGELYSGTRGADAARIAAQVVSGISFLCAGVIFKNGSTAKGLTTAAGLWGTACIGLTIGSGMWIMGLFATVIISALQIIMHRYTVGADSYQSTRLKFTAIQTDRFQAEFDAWLAGLNAQVTDCRINRIDEKRFEYDVILKTRCEITMKDLQEVMGSHETVENMALVSVK